MPLSSPPDPTTPPDRHEADTPQHRCGPGRPRDTRALTPSPRVQEQLALAAVGYTLGEIAERLGVSKQTVHQSIQRWSGRFEPTP